MHSVKLRLVRLLCAAAFVLTSFPASTQTVQKLILFSSAFGNSRPIPTVFTCDGNGKSPPLSWRNVPHHTQSLALTVDDPDAPSGDFVHWVIYDIPASASGLRAGVSAQPRLPGGLVQGNNSAGQTGFFGPCPPSGTHRYFFRLYALDNRPGLPPGATLAQLQRALQGHVLARTSLMGTYTRQ